MRIIGLVGWQGSGKTTLIKRLLSEFSNYGISVSTMKHAHHRFDLDQPGKDSYEHRAAGAAEVLISSVNRWAIMHEHRGAPEATFEELVSRMQQVDLLLVEGFKKHEHDKIEVYRPSVSKSLLCRNDPNIIAVASDTTLNELSIPVLSLDDVTVIADFIIEQCEFDNCSRFVRRT